MYIYPSYGGRIIKVHVLQVMLDSLSARHPATRISLINILFSSMYYRFLLSLRQRSVSLIPDILKMIILII